MQKEDSFPPLLLPSPRGRLLVVVALLVASALVTPAVSWFFWSFKVTVRNELGPGTSLHIRCTRSDFINLDGMDEPIRKPIREKILQHKEEVVIGHMSWIEYDSIQFECSYLKNHQHRYCNWTTYKYNTANPDLDGADRLWAVRPTGIYEKDPTDLYGYVFRFPHCDVFNPKVFH